MNKNHLSYIILLASCLYSLLPSTAYAETVKGINFEHKAWEITCDNTRTCRMAGYDNEEYEQSTLSILLERKAGATQNFVGYFVLADYDDEISDHQNEQINVFINKKNLGILPISDKPDIAPWRFSPTQLNALIQALKGSATIEFKVGFKYLNLSNSGFNAVMLKMDEFQGRVNTPTAIIKKGNLPASNNYAAIPPPVIRAAPVTTPVLEEKLTREELLTRFPNFIENEYTSAECSIYNDDNTSQYIDWNASLIQLDSQYSLLEIPCWYAAYNEGNGYWLIKNKETKLITTLANGYDNGRLFSSHRGRGLADCMSYENWTWNGQDFIIDSQINTGQCRLITTGGTWLLPTFVSDVRYYDKYE